MGFVSKSPQLESPSQRLPEVGDKVEIIGERGAYLVAHFDPQRYLVDLLPVGHDIQVHLGIHISAIRILPDPRTISHTMRVAGMIHDAPGDE